MPLAEAIRNPYQPSLMRIDEYLDETPDVRTLRLCFVDDGEAGRLTNEGEPGASGWSKSMNSSSYLSGIARFSGTARGSAAGFAGDGVAVEVVAAGVDAGVMAA